MHRRGKGEDVKCHWGHAVFPASSELGVKYYLLFCEEDLKDTYYPTAEFCFAVAKRRPIFILWQGRRWEQLSPDAKWQLKS